MANRWEKGREREGMYLRPCLFIHICSQTPAFDFISAQTTSNCWRLEEEQHEISAREIKISP